MARSLRLFKILNVAAKYRLDEFLEPQHLSLFPRLLFSLYSLPWVAGSARNLPKPVRLRLALQELGPIFIKFGQLLSTRRDFLDPETADELQALQDRVPPFSSPDITTLVQESLGQPVSRIFSSLDSVPLASASVAQVHAATLITGEEVVVKVIRPGIEKTIRADIALLKWIAVFIEGNIAIGKRLKPVAVIRDYEKVILDELDLLSEGANTSLLRRNFEGSPVLYVPKVYWDYTRSNILVMERIHGIPVSDVAALKAYGINLKKLAETGVEIFFTQVFDHSFFHADMHPGNIFVAMNNPEQPQYIAVDCAIIGSLNQEDQLYLARNLLAIFKRDYRKVAQLHVECGWVPRETPVHEFEAAMRTVCEPVFERPLKDISFGHLLVQLFRTAGRFNMEVQPSLVLLQKTLLNVEGLGRQLYPELDLWQTAMPFLENWNRRRLSPVTLFNRVKENIPDWLHQLPDLPRLVIDAITRNQQLVEINNTMQRRMDEQTTHRKSVRRRLTVVGSLALGAALVTAVFPNPDWNSGLPLLSLLLVGVGIMLLAIRP
ncbi:MAG: ubiquinone biosynthesis regulatory protein kinase UbiB [Pseudohongiellaceae bacterium]